MTKLKACADDKLNVAEMTVSVFDSVENTVGKGENAGYQHFLLFPQSFPKPSGSLKVGIVWSRVEVKEITWKKGIAFSKSLTTFAQLILLV